MVDITAPTLTLLGETTITLDQGQAYVEPGFSAKDAGDSDIQQRVEVIGLDQLDINTIGSYTLTYRVTDASQNEGPQRQRTINVIADVNPPQLTLQGSNPLIINYASTYQEPGYAAYDLADGQVSVNVTGSVDSMTLGDYQLTYMATDSAANSVTETRTVQVRDLDKPTIQLNGQAQISVEYQTAFTDPGVTVQDNYDQSLQQNLVIAGDAVDTNTLGQYTITYNVKDASGNEADQVTRLVKVVDTQKPVIVLNGENPMTITSSDDYVDPGATATDNHDTNVTVTIAGEQVNTKVVGSYQVEYRAKDSSDNEQIAIREVNVIDQSPPVITLLGEANMMVRNIDQFNDPSATAIDDVSGDVSDQIQVDVSAIDYTQAGSYAVIYRVEDAYGNETTATRSIQIVFPSDALMTNQLNDTGVDFGGEAETGNNSDCTGHVIEQQDCSHGRDKAARDGSLVKVGSGRAGLDFTKLDADGYPLKDQTKAWDDNGSEAAGTQWSCVKDNVTGLIWQKKDDTSKKSLRSGKDEFFWYDTGAKNGGLEGLRRFGDSSSGFNRDNETVNKSV